MSRQLFCRFCMHSSVSHLQTHSIDSHWQGSAMCGSCRSHKRSHQPLIVELLAGPLVGAAFSDKIAQANWGNLLIAIDPGEAV